MEFLLLFQTQHPAVLACADKAAEMAAQLEAMLRKHGANIPAMHPNGTRPEGTGRKDGRRGGGRDKLANSPLSAQGRPAWRTTGPGCAVMRSYRRRDAMGTGAEGYFSVGGVQLRGDELHRDELTVLYGIR